MHTPKGERERNRERRTPLKKEKTEGNADSHFEMNASDPARWRHPLVIVVTFAAPLPFTLYPQGVLAS